jgi:hypothetical protein
MYQLELSSSPNQSTLQIVCQLNLQKGNIKKRNFQINNKIEKEKINKKEEKERKKTKQEKKKERKKRVVFTFFLSFTDVVVTGAGSTSSILKWTRQLGSGIYAFTMIGDTVLMENIRKTKNNNIYPFSSFFLA